jgi:hypothetical protein
MKLNDCMKIFSNPRFCLCLVLLVGYASSKASASGSTIYNDLSNLRYSAVTNGLASANTPVVLNALAVDEAPTAATETKYKSPAKAFFLSLAVPGLGQYYYGSRIKPFIFLGVEAATWAVYLKWHKDGSNITDEFEAFNRTHWAESRYQEYLLMNYGVTDDDSVAAQYYEISHHLPDTRTQQYYEMTGKYDQFSWGWDDAMYKGHGYTYYVDTSASGLPRLILDSIPTSANRNWYENRRKDANDKFDQAKKMIMVSLVNHVVSAFEALYQTKKLKNQTEEKKDEFSENTSWKFSAKLKSYHSRRDTPYVTVTLKFK